MKKLIQFLIPLLCLSAFGQIPSTGLTSEYKFIGGNLVNTSGDDSLDQIGSALTVVSDRAGGADRALSLNGDYLQKTVNSEGNFDLSVSFWIKTTTNDATKRVIIDQTERNAEAETSSQTGWYVFLQNGIIGVAGNFQWAKQVVNIVSGTVYEATGFTGYLSTNSISNISDGNWHHITIAIFTNGGLRQGTAIRATYNVYVDGVFEATQNQTYTAPDHPWSIVKRFVNLSHPITIGNIKDGNSTNHFQETIDDVRFYSRTLDATDVTNLFNETGCASSNGVTAIAQDITIELDAQGNASISAEDIDNGSNADCNDPFTLSVDKTEFTCTDLGSNAVTLTATETYGAQTVSTAMATVNVTYAPEVISQDITVQLDASGQATIAPGEIDNATPTTGICGAPLTLSLDKTNFSCADIGANTVTLTADDGSGNTGSATATVTVEDMVAPVIEVQNISVNVDPATGFVTIDPTMINNGSTDNCSSALTMSLSQTRFTCEDTGDNTVTLTVEDENGNSATADAIVTVTSEVNNESLTVLNATICPDGTSGTTISTASSVIGFNYFLRDSEDNSIVDGPIAGTGNALDFATGNLSNTTTFNVFAEKDRVQTQTTLDFDGVNDYVNAGSDNRGISTQLTAAVWVKTTANSSMFLASKYDGINGFLLLINADGKATIDGRDGSGSYKSSGVSTTTVNDGEWHFIAGTIDLTTQEWKIYVDGILENEATHTTGTTLASPANFNIGAQSAIYAPGSLYQVTLWDVALDASTILANVSLCPTGTETDIVAHFTFEDGSGTVLTDHSASSINGTLVSMDPATDWTMDTSPSCGDKACDLQMANEITVGDTELPTILVQDIVAQIDINTGDVTITPDLVDNGSSDNCTSAGNLTYSLDKTNFTCEDVGENVVTLTITDESGNEATAEATVTISSAINDETITATNNASFCPDGSSSTISTGSSVVGINYFLRDSRDNSIVDGPIAGTGSGLDFNTGAVHATTTYNVLGTLNKTGGALEFDGVDDYVSLGNINRGVSTQVTIGVWIKTSASGSSNFIAGKFDFTNGWALYIDSNGKLSLDGRDGTGTYKQSGLSTTSVNDNQWHYVAGSINVSTGTWSIYVDGVLENSANNGTGTTLANSSLLTFGSFNTSYFTGQIDQFAMWQTELDASSIASFNTNCISAEDENSLVAFFNLNEEAGTGTTVIDDSQYLSNGIMVDMNHVEDRITGNLACVEICSLQMSTEITIGDDEMPTAVAQDVTIQLDANGNATLQASAVDNGSTDNCSTSLTFSLDQSDFTCADLGANTVTLTVADEAGNEATTTVTVTVEETIPPTVITQDITVQLDATGNVSIVTADIENGSTDNCTATENLVLSLDKTDFSCSDVGENTITLTVTDESGNGGSATALVTVEDVTAPTAVAQDIVVQLDANGSATAVASDLDNGSSDLCTSTLSFSLDNSTFTCSDLGANVVTLTVTDESGNQSTADATITVEDNIAPVIASQAVTVQLDATGNVSVDPSTLNNTSSDNCSTNLTFGLSQTDFDCTHIGDNTVSFSVTDENGNTSNADVTITVEDATAPTVITQDITIQLDANGGASITATEINNGSNDVCAATGNLILSLDQTVFSCADLGSNTVTLTVEDENGNTATETAIVIVEDLIVPTVLAQDITVRLDANNMASIEASDIDGGSSDNCGTPTLSIDISAFDDTDLGENTVILTATDASGNSSTASSIVTVLEFKQAQTVDFTTIGDLTYGAGDQTLSATASSNLDVTFNVISGPAVVSGNTLSITGVGDVVVEALQAGNDDFLAASAQQTFQVSKASLTVAADNQTITYGDAIPILTFAYDGFVNGEDATALTSEPTISTTAIESSDAGTYTITLDGGEATNYSITLVDASLIINKANQVITIVPIEDKLPTDDPFNVSASVDSGLPLTYSVTGPATISGETITLDGTEGTVVVSVEQVGDVNHIAATLTLSFEVTIPLSADNMENEISIYPNPTSDFLHFNISNISELKIYSLNGSVEKSEKNVSDKIDISDLAAGSYMIELIVEDKKINKRIIKAN
ncbi:LamG-like jellyroll fold domain-containing protein [Ekhidna sp.]|uniref:LamG-like jellyroll fold domain-containing protein n=1 Tax=Ekhidna sp. TaxID=2608089 RepID=UPI003298E47E